MNNVSTTEARAMLSELINRVAYGGERIGLTRRGQVVAVLVSTTDGEYLELEDESDAADAAARDRNEPTISLGELMKGLGVTPEQLEGLAEDMQKAG